MGALVYPAWDPEIWTDITRFLVWGKGTYVTQSCTPLTEVQIGGVAFLQSAAMPLSGKIRLARASRRKTHLSIPASRSPVCAHGGCHQRGAQFQVWGPRWASLSQVPGHRLQLLTVPNGGPAWLQTSPETLPLAGPCRCPPVFWEGAQFTRLSRVRSGPPLNSSLSAAPCAPIHSPAQTPPPRVGDLAGLK